jgi:hypothetical protein
VRIKKIIGIVLGVVVVSLSAAVLAVLLNKKTNVSPTVNKNDTILNYETELDDTTKIDKLGLSNSEKYERYIRLASQYYTAGKLEDSKKVYILANDIEEIDASLKEQNNLSAYYMVRQVNDVEGMKTFTSLLGGKEKLNGILDAMNTLENEANE